MVHSENFNENLINMLLVQKSRPIMHRKSLDGSAKSLSLVILCNDRWINLYLNRVILSDFSKFTNNIQIDSCLIGSLRSRDSFE